MHTGKDTSSVTHYGCGQNYCVVASFRCGHERTDGSKNGCKYVATNTDEAWGPIKPKPDAAAFVISMIVLWEKQVQAPRFHVVQRGQSDNGTRFMGALFKYMKSRGIQREVGALYTPEQVGGAERHNRAQIGLTRAMLMDASLPQLLWASAIACACILVNRIVSVGNRYHHMRCSMEL